MAHSNNIISSVKLPDGITYEIHDAQAIHTIEDLGLSAALTFKGTKETEAEVLAITSANKGDVWIVTSTNSEFVCTENIGSAKTSAWEKLGNVHDAASSTHKHAVTVGGTNEASTVTGNVTIPTVTKTQKYMTASASDPSVTPTTDSVLGANTTFTVSGGAASTSNMVTDKASKVTVTNKDIPNVTGNTEVKASKIKSSGSKTDGSAATWNATVTNGVLSFDWVPNTPTDVTLPTFDEVTATNTTLGTAISASSVSASDITVATGALASTGTGAAVATGVSPISVSASGDNVDAVTGVSVAAPSVTLTNNATNVTGSVPVVSGVDIGSTTASLQNGSAAAQTWKQTSGTTGTPQ